MSLLIRLAQLAYADRLLARHSAYNGGGLRMAKTVSGTTTAFTWGASQDVPLLLADGTASYIYGPGGMPLEQVTATPGLVA